MQSQRLSVLVGSLLAISSVFSGVKMRASTPEFVVTATNVTMPASGQGITHYTVSAIPMTGTLNVTCQYAGAAGAARIPTCSYGPVQAPAPVTAGQTITGTFFFYPYGSPIPLSMRRTSLAPAAGLALAGMLLGLGLRRKARHWLVLAGLAVWTVAGISACSGGMNGMTPGTYQYTISADDESGGNTPLGEQATTTISVTVP